MNRSQHADKFGFSMIEVWRRPSDTLLMQPRSSLRGKNSLAMHNSIVKSHKGNGKFNMLTGGDPFG